MVEDGTLPLNDDATWRQIMIGVSRSIIIQEVYGLREDKVAGR